MCVCAQACVCMRGRGREIKTEDVVKMLIVGEFKKGLIGIY